MPRDRTLLPTVHETAYNLRISGMSERAVYENLRDILDEPPSYRDLRAMYRTEGIYYRRDVTEARRENRYATTNIREAQMRQSDYLDRLAVTMKVDRTATAKDALDRNFVLGQLARSGVNPEDVADQDLRDSLVSIYDGHGS